METGSFVQGRERLLNLLLIQRQCDKVQIDDEPKILGKKQECLYTPTCSLTQQELKWLHGGVTIKEFYFWNACIVKEAH